MYSREYVGETLRFEASGGLINSSLVMQDKETDSYWSIMKGESISGQFEGTELKELPGTQKVLWQDWVRKHPETLVLSVSGEEDGPGDAYEEYLDSPEGFRGEEAADSRLETKQEVYAFRLDGKAYAARFESLEGGRVFQLGGTSVFLFRADQSPLFQSTSAFLTNRGTFEKIGQRWVHTGSGAAFNEDGRSFEETAEGIEALSGFDTYWYTWSPFHPKTEILR